MKSTQVLQRVGELPSKSTEACGDDKSSANDEHKGVGALSITGAPGFLNSLDTFVTGYETPPSGYATPPNPTHHQSNVLIRVHPSTSMVEGARRNLVQSFRHGEFQ